MNLLTALFCLSLLATGLILGCLKTSAAQLTLTWTDTNTNLIGIVGQRSTDLTNWAYCFGTAPSTRTYQDDTLDPSSTYYYRIYAINAAGNSPSSNIATGTTSSATGSNLTVALQEGLTVNGPWANLLQTNLVRASETERFYQGKITTP